ncbi:hypothetical protein GQ457_17G001040 [Hibiscus cannabinus]
MIHFICHDSLPTGHKLAASSLSTDVCKMCNSDRETVTHALRDCVKTKELLVLGAVDQNVVNGTQNTCKAWLEEAMQCNWIGFCWCGSKRSSQHGYCWDCAQAFLAGFSPAIERGWDQVIVEGDAISIVNPGLDLSLVGTHLREARCMLTQNSGFKVHYATRSANRVAQTLPHWALYWFF